MDISEDMQTEVDDILERYQRKMLQFLRIFRGEMDNQRRRTPLRIPRSLVRLFIKPFPPKDEPKIFGSRRTSTVTTHKLLLV